ncbi:hypothetical protein VC895_20965, partial [Citrobacter freundii]|nr:hypothetical protein [Citrobacter freundii]
ADRNRSHWSTSKTPSYTKSVSWQHHQLLASIPELNLMIEPRPSYASLYSINSVMFYIDSEKHEKLPIRFHCANQDLAERIANLLLSKGIEARAAIEMSHVD